MRFDPSLPGLALFASFLLATTGGAQETLRFRPDPDAGEVRRAGPAPEAIHVTYDVAAGRLRDRRPVAPDEVALGAACFDNSDLPFGISAFSPFSVANLGEELLDWGVKSCGGTGFVQSFTFAYRSTAEDTSIGGPGAALSVGVFSGTLGFNVVGSEVFRLTLSGLPGRGAPASGDVIPAGDAPIVFVTVDFGDLPLCLPDGPIGWAYMQLDGKTGPLLISAPDAGRGTLDALDVFSPGPATSGVYTGTFNFGSGNPFASLWLQVEEVVATTPASSTVVNGTGVNPLIFTETLPARLGETWVGQFDLSGHPGTLATLIFSASAPFPPTQTAFGELLIDLGQRAMRPLVSFGIHPFAVPKDLSLVGLTVHLQGALVTSTGVVLTNGLDVVPGF